MLLSIFDLRGSLTGFALAGVFFLCCFAQTPNRVHLRI
jgi:hypothetical protein